MAEKNANRRADTQGNGSARRGLKQVNDIMIQSSSIEDRVVTNPDPEEQELKRPQAKPIISINGEDVNRPAENEQEKRPAA